MNKTPIEWVKNPDGTQGYTWNPITGCLNHNNGLCKGGGFPCYAYKLANGRLKGLYRANDNLAPTPKDLVNYSLDPFYPRFWESRLYEPVNKSRRWGRQSQVVHTQEPKGIFVCDMSDLFGIGIPEEWTRRVLDRFQFCPQHRFYLLTKQPQNLIKFSPFPDNCWVGVTVTSRVQYVYALEYLRQISATMRYISFEPLLEQIGMGDNWRDRASGITQNDSEMMRVSGIGWLIIGAQTKPFKPPEIKWVEEIIKAADKMVIPVFLKGNIRPLIRETLWPEWSMDKRGDLRQEMPA